MTLHSLRDRALYVTPIRVVLGGVWLAAARLAGSPATGGLLAFAGGAFVIVFTLFNDPRSRFLRRGEAKEAPEDVLVASRVRQALHATLPSTAGVSALAAVSLVFQPTMSAFLGGISAGLGIAGALYALRADPALYVEPKSGVVYRR
ncbi:MAG TPA: hypothetical protein VLJ44_06525 [Gaiellaceae bacterium]|nr:hypothetical protein [Gaiellaceae bacterium]